MNNHNDGSKINFRLGYFAIVSLVSILIFSFSLVGFLKDVSLTIWPDLWKADIAKTMALKKHMMGAMKEYRKDMREHRQDMEGRDMMGDMMDGDMPDETMADDGQMMDRDMKYQGKRHKGKRYYGKKHKGMMHHHYHAMPKNIDLIKGFFTLLVFGFLFWFHISPIWRK